MRIMLLGGALLHVSVTQSAYGVFWFQRILGNYHCSTFFFFLETVIFNYVFVLQ